METNVRSQDRKILLEPMEGKEPKGTNGQIDPKLFKGDNYLHAVIDTQTMLWSLHFDSGVVPGSFKQQFTSFPKALKFVEDYYAKRNVKVSQVID